MTVALVTGAGSGIGKRVAELLAAAGHQVVGWDIHGTETCCDITDPAAVDDAMAAAVTEHGPPSRVVACAGVGSAGMLVDETVQDWNRVISINLTGTWLTLRAAARAMIATGTPGSMVAVSSISGTVVDRNMGAYCASKAAVDMLVKVAATEWGPHGIRVNAVGPGVTRTPMLARPEDLPGWVEGLTERTPLGRLGEADDVAQAALGVLELPWVTGQIVHADGGLALHSPIDSYGAVQRLKRQPR